MFVGSFAPDDFDQFQSDVQATMSQFQAANLTHLIVDLTNNGGERLILCKPAYSTLTDQRP